MTYELLLITYKALNGRMPDYITGFCISTTDNRLRPSTKHLLQVPRFVPSLPQDPLVVFPVMRRIRRLWRYINPSSSLSFKTIIMTASNFFNLVHRLFLSLKYCANGLHHHHHHNPWAQRP